MEVPTTEALSDWSSTLSEISYTAFVHSVAGVHLAASAFQLYRTMLSPAPRDPRDWGWADFRNVGSRIVTITWAIVGLWLSLFASAGRWALPLLILLTHIGSWSPRLLVWLLVFAPWLACKLAVRGGLRLAALPLRVAWRLSQLFPQCEPVTLHHPRPGGTVEPPPSRVSVHCGRVHATSVWLLAGYHVATRCGWTLPRDGRLGTQAMAALRDLVARWLSLDVAPTAHSPPVWAWAVPVFLLLLYHTIRPRRPQLRAPASALRRACEEAARNVSAGLELARPLLPAARQVRVLFGFLLLGEPATIDTALAARMHAGSRTFLKTKPGRVGARCAKRLWHYPWVGVLVLLVADRLRRAIDEPLRGDPRPRNDAQLLAAVSGVVRTAGELLLWVLLVRCAYGWCLRRLVTPPLPAARRRDPPAPPAVADVVGRVYVPAFLRLGLNGQGTVRRRRVRLRDAARGAQAVQDRGRTDSGPLAGGGRPASRPWRRPLAVLTRGIQTAPPTSRAAKATPPSASAEDCEMPDAPRAPLTRQSPGDAEDCDMPDAPPLDVPYRHFPEYADVLPPGAEGDGPRAPLFPVRAPPAQLAQPRRRLIARAVGAIKSTARLVRARLARTVTTRDKAGWTWFPPPDTEHEEKKHDAFRRLGLVRRAETIESLKNRKANPESLPFDIEELFIPS